MPLVQPLCNVQELLHLDPVVQSPLQLDLACFQGWDIYHFSEQTVPVLPLRKILLYI